MFWKFNFSKIKKIGFRMCCRGKKNLFIYDLWKKSDYSGSCHRIRCALFGEYVDELNRFLSSEYAEQPVVVLQLAKVKVFRGRVGLQNVMFASKLEFNLDIPEVVAFRKSSIPHGVSTSQPIGIVRSEKNIGIEEDFMKLTPKCTVKSLDDNNQ
ncbi:hypothetical protein S245_071751, partial [Arachis hypogaea]